MPDKCKGWTKPKGLTLLMEKSAWPPLSVQARSDMCEKRMPITHCKQCDQIGRFFGLWATF